MTRVLLRLLLWPLLAAFVALLLCLFVMAPTYTASALVDVRPSAGSGLARAAPMSPAQYGALLRSRRVADRIIETFDLQQVYGEDTLDATRDRLARAVLVGGSPSGLMVIQASDRYPWRATDLANRYAQELQRLLDEMRVQAAHARADRLHASVQRLQKRVEVAQEQLAASSLDAGRLKLDPALARSMHSGLRQSLDASERRLAVLRVARQDEDIAVQLEQDLADALRDQLHQVESDRGVGGSRLGHIAQADAAREVRLLEPLLKQLRLQAMQAEVDAGVRVESLFSVDPAMLPERPSGPGLLRYMAVAWAVTLGWLLARAWHRHGSAPWQPRRPAYLRSGGVPFSASTSRA